MKKYLLATAAVILLSCFIFGCGKKYHGAEEYHAMQEKHAAAKTYRDGVWTIRYNCWMNDQAYNSTFCLTVNVQKDMTKEDMLDIMDYYEFTKHAQWDRNGNYMGEWDTDYTCYAVFYKGNTDEEICRIKYSNGEEVKIQGDDKYCFAGPQNRSSEEEIGEEGMNGPLP